MVNGVSAGLAAALNARPRPAQPKNPLLSIPLLPMTTPASILSKIAAIKDKRAALVKLLDQPNLGTLRIDVNQALEEIDDLLDEFAQTFPEAA